MQHDVALSHYVNQDEGRRDVWLSGLATARRKREGPVRATVETRRRCIAIRHWEIKGRVLAFKSLLERMQPPPVDPRPKRRDLLTCSTLLERRWHVKIRDEGPIMTTWKDHATTITASRTQAYSHQPKVEDNLVQWLGLCSCHGNVMPPKRACM